MRTIIVGNGEIGKSLKKIFEKYYETDITDKFDEHEENQYYFMHICFPYSKDFIKQVKQYQKIYHPVYTIIHSTVPVGTSRKCNALHSPVVGLHPFLEESIKTFTKFIGGKQAGEVADYFRRANIKVYITDKQETTELMKIMCTTYHGLCIEFTKDIKRLCNKYKVPFELWTMWNDNYSVGYEALGHPEYKRPNLIPMMKKIGGHCVLPNLEFEKTKFTKFLKELNK